MDLTPQKWNWTAVIQGDTYPATQITESASDTALARVRVKVADVDVVTVLTLDSNTTGITITTATAGSWDFQIDAITAATTSALPAGIYSYDLETTDDAGTVRTEFSGSWQIHPQITD